MDTIKYAQEDKCTNDTVFFEMEHFGELSSKHMDSYMNIWRVFVRMGWIN